jgi:hypothetical protein
MGEPWTKGVRPGKGGITTSAEEISAEEDLVLK